MGKFKLGLGVLGILLVVYLIIKYPEAIGDTVKGFLTIIKAFLSGLYTLLMSLVGS
ncbi:MAG: hypothetical protein LBE83_02755 [Propionibacteriaceae bacterium]|nr:hypothetical protein [Propionibacteriaceae bacterium]